MLKAPKYGIILEISMLILEIIKAIVFGIVEGITEWLPVSSTGHIILLDEFLSLNVGGNLGAEFALEYREMFEVVIQLGAIMAVLVTFISKLNPFGKNKSQVEKKATYSLWWKIIIASVPAAIIGIVGDKILEIATGKDIDGWIFNVWVVSAMLIVYGILFIVVEKLLKGKGERVTSLDGITTRDALLIGVFQTLAIVPGTSRSGATILGARMFGISRTVAAEFSFFLGIPAMLGASALKTLGFLSFVSEKNISVPTDAWIVLLVAALVAFLVSLVCIKFLVDFVKKHTFIPFGVYRIILGAILIIYFLVR